MITEYKELSVGQCFRLWDFYAKTFSPLMEQAMQAQMMEADEFLHMCVDDRVTKILAHEPVVPSTAPPVIKGMAVAIDQPHLDAWPLYSEPYIAKHWPEEYARGAVRIIGCVGTDRTPGVFQELLDALAAPVREKRGVAFMDFCTEKINQGVFEAALRHAKSGDPLAGYRAVDQQHYNAIYYS